jgi:type II secretory pathway component GspD/PulD (secretin)
MKHFNITYLSLLLCLFTSLFVSSLVNAETLPWKNEKYTHYSEEEPLKDMLQAMASSQNTTAVISPKVDDIVSIYYKERYPQDILDELTKAHDLMWFYDGEALFIYKKAEAQTGSVSLKNLSVAEFSNTMRKLGILDDKFYWNELEEESLIQLKGPERFVTSVLQMAKIIDVPQATEEKIYKWKDENGTINFSGHNPNRGEKSNDIDVTVLKKENLYKE